MTRDGRLAAQGRFDWRMGRKGVPDTFNGRLELKSVCIRLPGTPGKKLRPRNQAPDMRGW